MNNLLRNLISFVLLAAPFWVAAQFDDLYYDPSRDAVYTEAEFNSSEPAEVTPLASQEELPSYSNEYDDYSYWDDQGYFYTSRIRRFHQPYQGFNYYDPIYTDIGFYDPWIMPGSSIYITYGGFNDYGNWRRMNRWRMYNDWMVWRGWNSFNSRYYMDPWSFNSWGAYRVYDPWFDPYWGGACFNTGWNQGWGYGNNYYVNNYYGQNYYYSQPGYWYGNTNGTVETNPANHYYGPRLADSRTGPSRGTVRNPEYDGGGIPRLHNVIGINKAPGQQTQGERGQVDGVNPGRNNGEVRKPNPANVQPNPPVNDPATGRDRVKRDAPAPAPDKNSVPRTEPTKRDEQPSRGVITPAQPERRDPLSERRSWSDMNSDQPQRPSAEERTRDSYRDDYIRQRENDRRPSSPQSDPRVRDNYKELQRPAQPERKALPGRERTQPNPSERERTSPSRRENSGGYEAPSREREMPSRSFENSGRNNSGSGTMDRGSSRDNNSSGSGQRSGSGRRGE